MQKMEAEWFLNSPKNSETRIDFYFQLHYFIFIFSFLRKTLMVDVGFFFVIAKHCCIQDTFNSSYYTLKRMLFRWYLYVRLSYHKIDYNFFYWTFSRDFIVLKNSIKLIKETLSAKHSEGGMNGCKTCWTRKGSSAS